MDITDVFNNFQTQEQAVEYLEYVRWRGRPACPYCESLRVGRHASGDRKGARWQCRACTRAFAATVGTIFHGTHVPLRNWFLTIAVMLNAKKPASAYQIARDLGMRRPTVWSMMHRIREAMENDPKQSVLLRELVEAHGTYIDGKPRRSTGLVKAPKMAKANWNANSAESRSRPKQSKLSVSKDGGVKRP